MTYSLRTGSRNKKTIAYGLVIVAVCVLAGFFGLRYYYQQLLEPVQSDQENSVIEVVAGATPQEVADILETEGIIRSSLAFQWHLRSEGLRSELKIGQYTLSPHLSSQEIATLITGGGVAEVAELTIFPERRLDQIRTSFIEAGFSPSSVDKALNPALYRDHPARAWAPAGASLEGYLYPETFQIDAMTTPQNIIELSLDQLELRLTEQVRTGIEDQGLTVHEGIILASIVEREVTDDNPDDRPRVAQVFYRRLAEGMRLESDITALYGAALDGLDPAENPGYSSPYNTYQNDGLPPTPISNVSESALQAVANPAETNFLYFVSGDKDPKTGVSTTYFSDTLAEHERLTRLYCSTACE